MAQIESDLAGIRDAAVSVENAAKGLPAAARLQAAAGLFLKAVEAHNDVVSKASKQKKVTGAAFEAMLAPLSTEMGAISQLKEDAQKGRDAFITHITALAEAVPALGWVTVEPAPGPYVRDLTGAAQFWTNKLLKEWKGKEGGEPHLALVTALLRVLELLATTIKEVHTTGLAWNAASGAGGAATVPRAAAATGGSAALLDELARLSGERLPALTSAATALGEPAAKAATLFAAAFKAHDAVVAAAARLPKKPAEAEQGALLAPVSEAIGALTSFKEAQRGPQLIAHVTALAEAAPAMGWLAVEPTPGPYLKEMIGAAQFWTNKILKEWKGKEGGEKHLTFVSALIDLLQDLLAYVLAYHTTGLVYGVRMSAPASASASSAPVASGALAAWDALCAEHFTPFLSLSATLAGPVHEHALLLSKAVEEERKLIEHALKTKPKPSTEAFQTLVGPLAAAMGAVGEYKEKQRAKDVADHLAAVAEGVQVLAWLTIEPAPAPFAKEAAASATFWTNKILKLQRGKDERHVEWVQALTGFLSGFEGYIKQWHTTGLAWGTGAASPPRPAAVAAPSHGGADADWAALVSEHLQPLVTAAGALTAPVQQAAAAFLKAAQAEQALMVKAKSGKKPNEAGQQELLAPVAALMGEVGELKEKNPKDACAWHLSALAEAVQAFGWVAVEPAPAPYAKEIIGAAAFWTNKILKEHKGKDGGDKHVAFVTALTGFLNALPPYIAQWHTTGLSYGK